MINKSIKFLVLLFLTFNVYAGGDDRDQVYYENLDEELAAFEAKVKEAGKMRAEGKSYIVQDGDVMHFLFNT